MSRSWTTRDYRRRFKRRHLGSVELMDAVKLFIGDATVAERQLRHHLESNGLAVGSPLVNADFLLENIDQIDDLPGGGAYWFHGLGCAIKVPGQATVDFDWRLDGTMVIDANRVGEWLDRHGARDVDPTQVARALSVLADDGVLKVDSGRAFYEVTLRPT